MHKNKIKPISQGSTILKTGTSSLRKTFSTFESGACCRMLAPVGAKTKKNRKERKKLLTAYLQTSLSEIIGFESVYFTRYNYFLQANQALKSGVKCKAKHC